MAKIRSLKYIKQEIERVEASIRKHAKGTKAAKAKKRVLNVLGKIKQTLLAECDQDSDDRQLTFTPIPPETLTTARKTTMKKTIKKKTTKKK